MKKLITLCFIILSWSVLVHCEFDDYDENVISSSGDNIPRLLTSNSSQNVNVNERLELSCQFNQIDNEAYMVMWQFRSASNPANAKIYAVGDVIIYQNRQLKVEKQAQGMKIILENVSLSDTGDYQCSLNLQNAEIAYHRIQIVDPEAKERVASNALYIYPSWIVIIPVTLLLHYYIY